MKHNIIINSEQTRNRAIAIMQSLDLDPVHEIIIREYKKDRSIEQHRFYWQILTIIANELGNTKEELHEIMKEKYLVNIYIRDNPEYAAMFESLRHVYRAKLHLEAKVLHKRIVELTSTTTANISQFREYLEAIINHATNLGIMLPTLKEL